jgi:hypothetical protein
LKDHRLVSDGVPLDDTCQNRLFWTDTSKGYPHETGSALGNVFEVALIRREDKALYLEHVTDQEAREWYWLMWYRSGVPLIPMSGVFEKSDLMQMLSLIGSFIP